MTMEQITDRRPVRAFIKKHGRKALRKAMAEDRLDLLQPPQWKSDLNPSP